MIIKSVELILGDHVEVTLAHDVKFIWDSGYQESIDRIATNEKYIDLIFGAIWHQGE